MEAAVQLGIDQAKISKLMAGQMAGFSIERLVHLLSLLGQDVVVTVRQAPRGDGVEQPKQRQSRFLYSSLSIHWGPNYSSHHFPIQIDADDLA